MAAQIELAASITTTAVYYPLVVPGPGGSDDFCATIHRLDGTLIFKSARWSRLNSTVQGPSQTSHDSIQHRRPPFVFAEREN